MAAAQEIEVPLQDFQCDVIFQMNEMPWVTLHSIDKLYLPGINLVIFGFNDRDNKLSDNCYNTLTGNIVWITNGTENRETLCSIEITDHSIPKFFALHRLFIYNGLTILFPTNLY